MFFNKSPPAQQQQQPESFLQEENYSYAQQSTGDVSSNEQVIGDFSATSSYDDDDYSTYTSSSSEEPADTDFASQYSPYTVSSMLGGAKLKQLSAPGQSDMELAAGKLDYLFQDEVRQRGEKGLSEKLCYNTGTMYALGLASGGAWGLWEGVRAPAGDTFRLRLNSVLNSCTRRGPLLGNSAGVMALFYTFLAHGFQKLRNESEDDIYNHIAAGALAGTLFKSTAGVKTALKTGVMFGGFVAAVGGAYKVYSASGDDNAYSPSSMRNYA